MSVDRWKCDECGSIVTDKQIEYYPHPVSVEHGDITVCPVCKSVQSFQAACWHPTCGRTAQAGQMHSDGVYRWSCSSIGPHSDVNHDHVRKS